MFNLTRKSNFKVFVSVLLLFALALSVCSCANPMKGTLKQYTSDVVSAVINKDQAAVAALFKAHYADDEIELMYMELAATLEGVSSFKLKSCKYDKVELDNTTLFTMTATLKTNNGKFTIETHTYTNSTGISHILITPEK